ncbi:MAG: thermonuclease family protein [Coriobacteriia bacterium]|nr:thermonuclease family protein [Coriobacteriia bacterium]
MGKRWFWLVVVLALLIAVSAIAGCARAAAPEELSNPVVESPVQGEAPQPETKLEAEPEPEPIPDPEPAVKVTAVQVTRVVDGDTIVVKMPDGTDEKIRFIGVDTPESTNQIEPYGKEASGYTANALSGKTIYLETDAELRDRYGRMLAHVWLSEPSVVDDSSIRQYLFNAHLVLAGYANLMTIPPNVKYVDYLKTYEAEARQASAGLWAPEPQVKTPASPSAPSGTAAAYIANKNTMKFHYAGCSSVNDMNESNKVPYDSRDKAVADGYVPCKRCNP